MLKIFVEKLFSEVYHLNYICKVNNNVHSIFFSLVLPVGAINENKTNSGITHFIEHLCFRKAEDLKQTDLYDFCEQRGVKINAATGKNFLWFYFVSRPTVYDDIIKLFQKMFFEINYSEEDLLMEGKVVAAEIDEFERTNEIAIIDSLWHNKKFSNSILGDKDNLNSFNLFDIVNYKKKLFSINGTIFLFGNFSDEQCTLTKNCFCIHDCQKDIKPVSTKISCDLKKEIKFIKDEYNECEVYYASRINFKEDEKYHKILCLQMINSALFQGDKAYITETLRDKLGYIYEINSTLEILENEAILLFKFRVNNSFICATVNELENLLKNFVFDFKYYSYIKAFFNDNVEMLIDNFNDYAEQWVDNYITFGRPFSPEEKAKMINEISLSEYNSIYSELLKTKCVYFFGNISSSNKRQLLSELKM